MVKLINGLPDGLLPYSPPKSRYIEVSVPELPVGDAGHKNAMQSDGLGSSFSEVKTASYFRCVRLPNGQTLPTPDHEQEERRLFPRFLRCDCCLDDDAMVVAPAPSKDEEENRGAWKNESDWFTKRDEFIQQLASTSQPQPNLHNICGLCAAIFSASDILRHRSWRRLLSAYFSTSPRVFESFQHHLNPLALKESAESCHCCHMIWKSLSPEQQLILLNGDKKICTLARTQGGWNVPESNYSRRRRIRLIIRKGGRSNLTQAINPAFRSKSRKSLFSEFWTEERDIWIIPHFGGMKRPQRWYNGVVAANANAIATYDEYVDPFLVAAPSTECSFKSN